MTNTSLARAIDAPHFPPSSYPRPLAALLAEHDNQYEICLRLENLAEDLDVEPMTTEAAALKAQLTVDLPRHEAFEEQHLFPLLRRRCRPRDKVKSIIARLYSEHARDDTLVEYIADDLELIAGGFRLANPLRLRLNIKSFVAAQRRHLDWENEVVLPLAGRRLTPEDIVGLGCCLSVQARISDLKAS
jgi:hemerythrin-like domain-containing protein